MAAAPRPQKNQWNNMIAGGMAGSVAVLFLHPFDVIKTRLQGISWAAYFAIYEAVKAWHCRWQGKERLSPGWNMASAAQAGAMVCFLTNPIWLVKTRLQLQRLPLSGPAASAASAAAGAAAAAGRHVLPYNGFLDALVRIGREEGLKGYYKGLGPSLVLVGGWLGGRQTMHGAVQFAVYDELKYLAARVGRGPGEEDRQLGSGELSVFAASSKLTASVSTYPSQVVRSRLQQRMDDGRTLVYRSTGEVIRLTWKREGLLGFYKGIGPALLRVMPQSAVTLVAYENILRMLDAATAARQEARDRDVEAERAASGQES
ncbi:hypothetical protein GPECTOR_75g723 [Gonium pectorale]|uniref:Uncharacterized protein n=1 Tax=Gonium pectorale TaxID=33097 RepID=A0A150G3Y0_GONPE|nr:hypothetical protein GPECTOR_75g723 [Gonium pectorale]|eukprot:KXZ44000.1 hypothetical protein GPECTOR_75g723 [Gonium pectorale]